MQGGEFGHGFAAAGAAQAAAPGIGHIGTTGDLGFGEAVARVAAAAAVGGTISEVTGGKFANGAVTGAFSQAFNDLVHEDDLSASQKRRDKIVGKINEFISDNPGEAIPISGDELSLIMDHEILVLEYTQQLFGDYESLNYQEFLNKLEFGDSRFLNYAGERFNISGDFPLTGTYLAEDINYYYQGFITAAAGRSWLLMHQYISAWNIRQAITRPSFHDIRQIYPAQRWARVGYSRYNEVTGN